MRLIDAVTLAALNGSRPADTLTVWAWRNGTLVVPEPLQVLSWSAEDAAGESVKVAQKLTLTVADPDGSLGAWLFEDALSVAGTRLQVIYRVGGAEAVNYGWFRISTNDPTAKVDSRVINEYGLVEPDSVVAPHSRRKYATTGTVQLDLVDLTANVDLDKLEAPESASTATVLNEIARLVKNHFPVVTDPGVTDVNVSPKLIFDRERLEAVQDLAARVNARYRMGGDGECHIYPRTTATVWRVEPGNGLVNVTRKQSLDGLYNRWIVDGKDSGNGAPVRGRASIDTGPLRYGGAHGRIPFFYSSETITSYGQALTYAIQLRDEFLATLAAELTVDTIPRPELQAGDWIEVGCPLPDGHVAYLPGQITGIRRAGDPVPRQTTLTVSCTYADVTAALNRTDWAKNLTTTLPALTWDRMPGQWGQLPVLAWNTLP
jgi:hypothetical protein